MLSEKMVQLGTNRSVIRDLFEYGNKRKAEIGAENVFDFSIGNPSVPAPECVKEAAIDLLTNGDPVALHGYTSAQGDAALREKLASYVNEQHSTNLTADNFYVTVGAAASLTISLKALAEPDDEFITFAPFFPEYRVFVEMTGSKLVVVPSRKEDFQIDTKLLEDAITEHTKGIILNSPNNPSGVVLTEECIKEVCAVLEKKQKEYGKEISRDQKENIVNVLTNEFPAGSGKKTYSQCVFIEEDASDYKPTESFIEMLKNDDFYTILKELVEFGISRYERDYSDCYENSDLVLYQKYTYEEVCRLLNWEKNLSSVMNGYMLDKKTKTYPVFINYDKSDDISDTTKYEDHFVEGFRDRLIAISKSGRKLQSDDVQNFLKAKERGIQVELFVRKNKDDKISKEFYYLGHMTASGNAREFTMANTEKSAVEIEWILDVPVREDIYEYIVSA